MPKSHHIAEFGDFQTPLNTAAKICALLAHQDIKPATIIEPTCGQGNFLLAAAAQFTTARRILGYEINPVYVLEAQQRAAENPKFAKIEITQGDFFEQDWGEILANLPQPILIIGNPPWVTNADLGALESHNLPKKRNFKALAGLEARTGKSNFDISEWMLIQLLTALSQTNGTLAMLCKTSVARKVLHHAWKVQLPLNEARLYTIDAKAIFNAAVDACLFVCEVDAAKPTHPTCAVYSGLETSTPQHTFGFAAGRLIADLAAYTRWQHLKGTSPYQWRSGVKHDCAGVMELKAEGAGFRNKISAYHELEDKYLYPMLKSSDIARSRAPRPTQWMLVPQRFIGEATHPICHNAPRTWNYLNHYAELLDKRKSSIYKGQPRFAVFGVGEYSFAPWKIAISGLYKKLHFAIIAPFAGKPVLLDDTCYFLPCQTESEANTLYALLSSEIAQEFFNAFIFWDAKRPITIEVLQRLDLRALSYELYGHDVLQNSLSETLVTPVQQLALFEQQEKYEP